MDWPANIPVPLFGRRHTKDPRALETEMETGHIRKRPRYAEMLHLVDVEWNFTGDEFDAFKTFFEQDLQNGTLPFTLVTYDPAPETGMILEVTRDLEFFTASYEHSHEDNVFHVTSTIEVINDSVESIPDPFKAPPEIEFEYDVEGTQGPCRHTLIVPCEVEEGVSYILQIADDSNGPWADHVYFTGAAEETIRLHLNNDYWGVQWFRVIRQVEGTLVKFATKPLASTVEPPSLQILNVPSSARGLLAHNGFTYPYSMRENGLISPDQLYIVPRDRRIYVGPEGTADWDGNPQTVLIGGEAGATHKWTRDGNDPTEDTVIEELDGQENHLAAYRSDFRFIIKARSFKNGCKSPMTCYLVDRQKHFLPYFESIGGSHDIALTCDDPKGTTESGNSCALRYGDLGGMIESSLLQAYSSATDPDNNTTKGSQSVLGETPKWKSLYSWGTSVSSFVDWLGWTVNVSHASAYIHKTTRIHASTAVEAAPSFVNHIFRVATDLSAEPVELDQSFYLYGDQPGSASSIVGDDTLIGTNLDFVILQTGMVGDHGILRLYTLDLLFTIHDDFALFTSPGYVPPDPVISPPAVPLPEEMYADKFDAYVDSTDATALVLEEGTGWNGAWTLHAYPIIDGVDDFESYGDGTLEETDDTEELPVLYEGGSGWGGPWYFRESPYRLYSDTFEDYTDGEAVTGSLSGGTGWLPPSGGDFWVFYDYAHGVDDFEDYDDGDATLQTLDGGNQWAGGGWALFDYEP